MWLCVLVILFIGSSSRIFASVTTSKSPFASLTCGSWSVVPSPNPSPNDGLDILPGVTAVSTNNVWAVGDYTNGLFPDPDLTLIEHWNGSSWTIVASPNIGSRSNSLSAVAAVSANDIWAVGSSYDYKTETSKTLIQHWDGTKWSVVNSPNPRSVDNQLSGIAVVSNKNIWVVGTYNAGNIYQTLIEHWNGTSWQVVPGANSGTNNNYLIGVAAISANNIWAVGNYTNSNNVDQTLIEQRNGIQWSVVSSPSPDSDVNVLYSMAVDLANNIWAVAYYRNIGGANQTLTEFYC